MRCLIGISGTWLITVMLGAAGCSSAGDASLGDPDGDGGSAGGKAAPDAEIEERCRDSADLSRLAAEARCECMVASGERPDQESCIAASATPESTTDCVCPIYALYPDSNVFIDCFLPVQQAHEGCLAEAMCDAEKVSACDKAFVQGHEQCPLPVTAADEVAEMCDLP